MNLDHLKHIDHRTVYKPECFVDGTPESQALIDLMDRNKLTFSDRPVGGAPILANAGPGDLVILLFRADFHIQAWHFYTHRYTHAHACIVHEHKGTLYISDFNERPHRRKIDNLNPKVVRLVKTTDRDYDTVLHLCQHPLTTHLFPEPIQTIPKSL